MKTKIPFLELSSFNNVEHLWYNLVFFIIGYFIGSLIISILISKYIYKKDVRKFYSKNPGTTNSIRVLGYGMGSLIGIFDVSKGILSVVIAIILKHNLNIFNNSYIIVAGFGSIIGHCFPIEFGFKGGKGFASFLGVILIFNWMLGLSIIFIWILLNVLFKYVSVATIGSMFFAVVFSTIPYFGRNIWNIYYPNFSNSSLWYINTIIILIIFIIITIRHSSNVKRLLNKTENYSWIRKFYEKQCNKLFRR